jgi:polyphosphate kinase
VYGFVGLKTHCKTALVVRQEGNQIRRYAHVGTGNYNPKTARLYTDLSLFSANKELAQEVAGLFNTLTGLVEYTGFKKLMVAPFDLAPRMKALIQRERDNAKAGKPAGIVAKIKSLVDEEIIVALYEASNAGVKIDLIVRGICALRPQIPGVSENIRVISIIGRFLEHSRIYSFTNGGSPEVYLASADWMPRNLYRRVETAFIIEDPTLRDELINEVLPAFLSDRVKARELRADGSYVRLKRPPGVKNPPQAQLQFRARARALAAGAANAPSPAPSRLQPQQVPPTLDVTRADGVGKGGATAPSGTGK